MKTLRVLTATFLCILIPSSPVLSQIPPQDAEVIVMPGGGTVLQWHGHAGRTYFIQGSDPNAHLENWTWSPYIEFGNDGPISHECGTTADKAFFRLHYTDTPPPPEVSLEDWDADGDGLPNALELQLQSNPLNADTSGDGIPDGWAYAHGLHPAADNASGLFQGGAASNLEAYQQGVQANPAATIDDYDGDGVNNEDDADPQDADVDWQRANTSSYVLIEIDVPSDPGHIRDFNDAGQVLFDNGVWHAGAWEALSFVEISGTFVEEEEESETEYQYTSISNFGWRLSPHGDVLEQGLFNVSGPGDFEEVWHILRRARQAGMAGYSSASSTLHTLDWHNDTPAFVSLKVLGEDASGRVFAFKKIHAALPEESAPAVWILNTSLGLAGSYGLPGGFHVHLHGNQVTPSGWLAVNASPHTGNAPAARTIVWNPSGQEITAPGGLPWYFSGLTQLPHGKPALACRYHGSNGLVYLLNQNGDAFKTAEKLGGKRIHTFAGDGTAMTSDGKMWINGELLPLRDLCPAYGDLLDDGWDFQIYKANKQGAYLLQAHKDEESRPCFLLPLDMAISHPELEGDDPPNYVVNADIAETLVTVGLSPAGDGSIIEWKIEEGDGTLSVTESNTTDGFASTTLTTSTSAGDTYRVKARIKKLVMPPLDEISQPVEFDFSASEYANLTGIEQTTDVITVIPGYAASITVQREPTEPGGSTTSLPADGVSEMSFVATVKDQFGQPVAEHTPVVWHLGGLGFIEPETPATDAQGIARATLVAGDAGGPQTVRSEADGFEVNETLENSAITGTLTAGATTLDIATSETTTLTANFPDVADGATIRWFTSRGEILDAATTVESGQATATLRAGGGRIGNAIVTAAVGAATHATEIGFVSSSPISVEIEHPVIVGDETADGTSNVPRIDGTSQSVAYRTGTPVTIKAPAYAGQTATVQIGTMASDIVARFHMDEITGTVTPDSIAGHDATIHGAIPDANHRHEGDASLYFDGTTSSLNIADHADLRIQSGLAVSAWVHAAATNEGTIIHKPGEYRLFIDWQGRVVFGVATTAGEQLVIGPSLPLHRWSRISASREPGGAITISVDGMKAISQTVGNLTPGTSAISIGESYEGWIDLLEITRGNHFTNGTGLEVTGLSGGQVVLDGNGEAVFNLSSGQQSVVSPESPVHGVAMRVSINPEVELEDVVVVVTKEVHAVMNAAMSDMIVTTASQSSNLSGAIREDVVARNLLEFARTGQRSSALPFVPAGSITDRLRYSHRAALWLGETVVGAQEVRDILENSHLLDLPAERKYHLSDQIHVLLIESMRGGSDSGAGQYLDQAFGGLVGTLADASGQQNFPHLTAVVDGQMAFEDLALAHENFGGELIQDIAILAGHESDDPTFGQRVFGILRSMNEVVNGQMQQAIFDSTEDFLRKYLQQAVANGDWTEDGAFRAGFGWGLAAEGQAVSQLANQRAAKRLGEQMAATIIAAIRGDENARKGLTEAIPLWGLKVMNDESNSLAAQGLHFVAGMKSAQLTVAAVGTATAAGGMIRGGLSVSRAAKNAAQPIKGGPPKTRACVGWSKRAPSQYAENFFDSNPHLRGKVEVHHAIEKGPNYEGRYPGLFTPEELASAENLRGIPKTITGNAIHRRKEHIRGMWNEFYKKNDRLERTPTREELLSQVDKIDDLYGDNFNPKVAP